MSAYARSAALLRDRRAQSRHHPKVISERIGHANVGFFLQTYAHVLGNDDREAAEQAAAFLIGDGWDPPKKATVDDEPCLMFPNMFHPA